ncbi:PP2C family protein-serine/threonine phosphatase [Hugenholtzia roseola]|uniref:PP2C family protein-serine/threonine phosphatase n=1 Tax=Hugenholtzia roseola TaxID=1002 RepID=UPI0004225384|nr:protein phosphatase 2C domain-containing protein [Hugenholtzia roseola]
MTSAFMAEMATHAGKTRSENQDALDLYEQPLGRFAFLCDGMGGHQAGAKAAQIAIQSLRFYFDAFLKGKKNTAWADLPLKKALQEAFETAQAALVAQVAGQPQWAGMGTTAVVLLLAEKVAYCAHVGDSRLYVFKNQTLSRLTKDHSVVQSLLDQKRLSPQQALQHPQRSVLTRVLGGEDYQPDIQNLSPLLQSMQQGDMFLLCSDGLTNELSDSEIETVLLNFNLDLKTKAEYLLAAANRKGGHDNISLILLEKVTA